MFKGGKEETTRGTKGTKSHLCASCAFCGFFFILPAVSTATTTATTTAAAMPATTAAIFTRGHWPGFGDSHVTSAVFGSIELLDGIRRFLIRRHLDESEAFAAACIPISDDFGGLNAARLSEDFLQRLIRRIERKVANI
jgi:hypothetical protein